MADHRSGEIQRTDMLLDSTLETADAAEDAVLRAATEIGFPEDDLHTLAMAVREAVVNAVVHGNRYSSKKKVHLTIARTPSQIAVTVGDEGEGFNMESVPDPLAEENLMRQSGRGLLLMRAFMDELDVRPRTPNGTEIHLVKKLARAE